MTNETSKAEGLFQPVNAIKGFQRAEERDPCGPTGKGSGGGGGGRHLFDSSPLRLPTPLHIVLTFIFLLFQMFFRSAPPAGLHHAAPNADANGQQFPIRFYFTNGRIDPGQLF